MHDHPCEVTTTSAPRDVGRGSLLAAGTPRSADAPRPPNFGIHVVLPEHLSEEPLGIVVRTGDGG